ncbi:MAG: hypothetical protein RLZZ350_1670, partial [Verrucomicrobiota bacterium]
MFLSNRARGLSIHRAPANVSANPMNAAENFSHPRAGFARPDWLAFAGATAVAFVGYWFTLAPNLTLGDSGELSVAANYAGVPNPPGYPAWVLASWLWIKIFPFGNIAWRLAVESALCASLAGGLVALMVSRTGALLLDAQEKFRQLPARDAQLLRVAAGVAAGLGFCFDRAVWFSAVRVDDVWASNLFCFALMLALGFRWFLTPERTGFLCAAFFVFGLGLTNCEILLCAALGLHIFITLGRPTLGRDFGLVVALICWVRASAGNWRWSPMWPNVIIPDLFVACSAEMRSTVVLLGAVALASCLLVTWKTRRLLTEWKTVLTILPALGIGLMLFGYVPLASMSNPPMNWGYPRNVEGFWHVSTRACYCYERFFTSDFGEYFRGLGLVIGEMVRGLGKIYFFAPLLTLGLFRRA